MNHTSALLSPTDAAWLTETAARNRRRFGGWTMEADPEPDPKPDPKPDPTPDPKPDKGFPENTQVKDMTAEQQAAYYQHQARKHEDRNRDLLKITGGKYGDDLKAQLDELDKLRDKDRTDGERAVEEAKVTTRAEVRKEFGTKLAAAEFRAALGHVDDERRDQIIEGLSLERYLTDDGEVDTDKVKAYASTIAPADKGPGKRDPDYGAGRRKSSETTGVASGRDLFESRRKKSTTSTS